MKGSSYARSYGFIARDDGEPDCYLGELAVERNGIEVTAGSKVKFSVRTNRRGKTEADRVEVIDDDAVPAAPSGAVRFGQAVG